MPTRLICLLMLVALVVAGCGEKKPVSPGAEAFKAVLEGAEVETEDETMTLSLDDVGLFKLEDVVAGTDGMAIGIISFTCSGRLGTYRVEGTVMYRPAPDGGVREPVFEVSDVQKTGS